MTFTTVSVFDICDPITATTVLTVGSPAQRAIGIICGARELRHLPGSALPIGRIRFSSAHSSGVRSGVGFRIKLDGTIKSARFEQCGQPFGNDLLNI